MPEKTQKCFGRVKEKKPPPRRKRKCLVWSFCNDDFVKTTVVEWERIGISKDDLAGENAEVLRESEGEEASAAAEEEVFGLDVTEGNLLLYSV
ncbi:uncharacterized protein G2W53_007815 [Senna tora]|uniref:Uncharacterized protein n=1 Tax=Senna tora TaxID=362788 RepID=A0A834X620_9FABA|nr:uncharacterized protein G2W53_007815 [Senna tora]